MQPITIKMMFLLLVPVFIAFMGGIYFNSSISQFELENSNQQQLKILSSENHILLQSVLNSIEQIRLQALELENKTMGHPQAPLPKGALLHWAVIKIKNNRLEQAVQTLKNGVLDSQFENHYLMNVINKMSVTQIFENGVSILRIKQDLHSNSEWLSFGFKGVSSLGTVLVVLVDPSEAFSVFKQLNPQMRAYLMGSDGYVLAHSQPTYAHADFAGTEVFNLGFHKLLQGVKKEDSARLKSIDQNEVFASFIRVGTLPLGVVLEQVVEGGGKSYLKWARKSKKIIFTFFGLFCLGMLLVIKLVKKNLNLKFKKTWPQEVSQAASSEIPTVRILDHTPVTQALEDWVESDSAVSFSPELKRAQSLEEQSKMRLQDNYKKEMSEENQLLDQFEKIASTLRDPQLIAQQMTQVATKLAQSPSLFFTYRSEVQAAILQSDAGFPSGEAPATMSFPLHSDTLQWILEGSKRGDFVSLSQYSPLGNILMARTGVAHYEAWPVTGYGPLGRQASYPRLLGILVILQAGVDTALHEASLKRMLRSTGLIYENTLLSQ